MLILIGADHRGFKLKEDLRAYLSGKGYEVADLGNQTLDETDDYTDFAIAVGLAVSRNPAARGILACGSGAGMAVTANKFKNVRASLGFSTDQIFDARSDDDLNVLVLAANFTSSAEARKITDVFLATPFQEEERHHRRLEKIRQIESSP